MEEEIFTLSFLETPCRATENHQGHQEAEGGGKMGVGVKTVGRKRQGRISGFRRGSGAPSQRALGQKYCLAV
jgi:hypothetical protein